MGRNSTYQYYVEGDDEKHLINILKKDLRCIVSGKVDKFNAVQQTFTTARIRPLKQGTIIVLVYDTDIENVDILEKNIRFLNKQSTVKALLCIPQCSKLEDELEAACGNVTKALEITHSKGNKNFKRDLINCTNLGNRLTECAFDICRFWSKVPKNQFAQFGNDAERIKIK